MPSWNDWFAQGYDPTSFADNAIMSVAPEVMIGRETAQAAGSWWDYFFGNSPAAAAAQDGGPWQSSSDFTRRVRALIRGRAQPSMDAPPEVFAEFAEIARVYDQAVSFNGFWRWLEARVQHEVPTYSAFGEGYYVPAKTIQDDIWDIVSFIENGVAPPLQPARKTGSPQPPEPPPPGGWGRRATHRR